MTIGNRLDEKLEKLSVDAQNRIAAGVGLLLKMESQRSQFEEKVLQERLESAWDTNRELEETKCLLDKLF